MALTLCAVSGLLVGAATVAQAGPAAGLEQAAPGIATTQTFDGAQVDKAYWHRHYWHRHYWHRCWHCGWHHWHHWRRW
jgi:hypothetical protein